ncbi:MAG: molybdenum cofactor guanylyltransferase, partial [Oscillospiraceae bacterium]
MRMKTAAVILAGGMSRRMGRDKAALPFGEETMLS